MQAIRAVLFDLDGTLVDSEVLTDRAIAEVLAARGSPGAALPPALTRGRTWDDIAAVLVARYPGVDAAGLSAALDQRWIELAELGVEPIPGAPEMLAEAQRAVRLGVVSSSPRRVIDAFLQRMRVDGCVAPDARVGAGDVASAKPAPDGFLAAARRLGAAPAECLVFEDSSVGLLAARAAGMSAIVVLHACAEPERCRALAWKSVQDYRALPAGFFARLEQGLDVAWP